VKCRIETIFAGFLEIRKFSLQIIEWQVAKESGDASERAFHEIFRRKKMAVYSKFANRKLLSLFATCALFAGVFGGDCRADMITLIPVSGFPTGANANALAGPLASSSLDSVDIPGSGPGAASATKDGNTSTHDFGVGLDYSASLGFFDSTYSGTFFRTADLSHRATAESIFHFSVDVPTEYGVMGSIEIEDALGTTVPGDVELEVELFEFDSFSPGSPPPVTLFYSYQFSKASIDQTFMVGGTDGDTSNTLVGSPVGILDPSKVYTYRTLVTMKAIDDGGGGLTDGTASLSGGHTIVFSSAVPEPSTGVLWFAVSVIVFSARRIRRQY